MLGYDSCRLIAKPVFPTTAKSCLNKRCREADNYRNTEGRGGRITKGWEGQQKLLGDCFISLEVEVAISQVE